MKTRVVDTAVLQQLERLPAAAQRITIQRLAVVLTFKELKRQGHTNVFAHMAIIGAGLCGKRYTGMSTIRRWVNTFHEAGILGLTVHGDGKRGDVEEPEPLKCARVIIKESHYMK